MHLQPDLCLVAFEQPQHRTAAAAAIGVMVPHSKVVVVAEPGQPDMIGAIDAGAVGYFELDGRLEQLPGELWRVLDGEALLSGQMVARLLRDFRAMRRRVDEERGSAPDALLTRREAQVMEHLSHHFSTAEIARRLAIEQATVRAHISAVLGKYGVANRQAAIREYRERRVYLAERHSVEFID